MRKIEFSPDEIKPLSYQSIHHPHHIVRRRMQALLLKSQRLSHQDIGQILAVSQPTLRDYFDRYLESGIKGLETLNYQGRPNLLQENRAEIIAALEADPPATLKEAQATIKAVTGLERSLTQVGKFLKKTS